LTASPWMSLKSADRDHHTGASHRFTVTVR
jgi:hypothetical protein